MIWWISDYSIVASIIFIFPNKNTIYLILLQVLDLSSMYVGPQLSTSCLLHSCPTYSCLMVKSMWTQLKLKLMYSTDLACYIFWLFVVCCRNGLQHRRNSWQDGTPGTMCPIPPGKNFTYVLQPKDQIGSYFYFPSLGLQKAAGGYGGIRVYSRPRIPVPFPPPAREFTVLAGDWYKRSQRVRKLSHSFS